MAWGSDMCAGFALAALLADDRELAHVAGAVPDTLLPALRAQLGQASEREVRALLRVLRPDLDHEVAQRLPARMRALLARRLPSAERQKLREGARESRPDFDLDDELQQLLLRIARRPSASESA